MGPESNPAVGPLGVLHPGVWLCLMWMRMKCQGRMCSDIETRRADAYVYMIVTEVPGRVLLG